MVVLLIPLSFVLLITPGFAGPLKRNFEPSKNADALTKRYKALPDPDPSHRINARTVETTTLSQELSGNSDPGLAENATVLSQELSEANDSDLPEGETEDGKVPAVGVGSGNTSLLGLLSSTLDAQLTEAAAVADPGSSTVAAEDPAVSPTEASAPLSDTIPTAAVVTENPNDAANAAAPAATGENEDGKVPAVGVGAGNTSLLELLSSAIEDPAQPPAATSSTEEQATPEPAENESPESAETVLPEPAENESPELAGNESPESAETEPPLPAQNESPVSAENEPPLPTENDIPVTVENEAPVPAETQSPEDNVPPASATPASTSCASESSSAAIPDATNVIPVAVAVHTGDANSSEPTATREGLPQPNDLNAVGEPEPTVAGHPPIDIPATGPPEDLPESNELNAAGEPEPTVLEYPPIDGPAPEADSEGLYQDRPEAIAPDSLVEVSEPEPTSASDPNLVDTALAVIEESPATNLHLAGDASSSVAMGETATLGMESVELDTNLAVATAPPIESPGEEASTVTITLSTTVTATAQGVSPEVAVASAPSLPIGLPESLASTTVTPLAIADPQTLESESPAEVPTPTPEVTIQTPEDTPEAIPTEEALAPVGDVPGMTIPLEDFTIVVNSAAAVAPTALIDSAVSVEGSCPTATVTITVSAT